MRPVVIAGVLVLGVYQVQVAASRSTFVLWAGERRYVVAAQMVRRLTDRNSVIISGQHTGSLRFYGSRMTMHYDAIDHAWVDRVLAWLAERGVRTYLLLEPWEIDGAKKDFEGQHAAAVFGRPPIAIYREPGTLYFWELTPSASDPKETEIVTGTYNSLWAVEKAPDPRLVFKP